MPANTAQFSKLLAPGLRKVFFENYKQFPEEYSRIANVETSKRAFEEELTVMGLGLFNEKPEGTKLTYDAGKQGNVKRYTHVSYSQGFRVTREMWQDDLYNVMKRMSKELATSARLTIEYAFGELLDDAFDGNTYTGADGQALCAQHTLLVGDTYTNQPAAQTDLGIGALRSASERMERTPNERGLPDASRGRGKTIVVSPTYQWVAEEILKTELKPYTADNTTNVMNGMGMEYFVTHYTSDDDLWLLLASKAMHDIKFFWRLKPQFENEDDFDTKGAKFSGYMRFSLGFTDWRGVDGSSGSS